MVKLTAPCTPPDDDVTTAALTGWGATARLAVIRLSESDGPALMLLLAWLCRR